NLTNGLPAGVSTSLVIVGQLGGGLGGTRTVQPSQVHPPQGPTWPIAGDNTDPTFNPPAQGDRVKSLATEVANGCTSGATCGSSTTPLPTLTWANLRPGTYLLESGTHPSIQGSMGLFGILVVTSAPTASGPGTAYPGVAYDAEVPLVLSEIDPVQNMEVDAAVRTAGFSETATYSMRLRD